MSWRRLKSAAQARPGPSMTSLPMVLLA
eukprot:COSAG02_NODE_68561_length_237_cov_5.594203_1_plen_27_part_10